MVPLVDPFPVSNPSTFPGVAGICGVGILHAAGWAGKSIGMQPMHQVVISTLMRLAWKDSKDVT